MPTQSGHRSRSRQADLRFILPAAPVTNNREILERVNSPRFNMARSVDMKGIPQELNGNIGIVLPEFYKLDDNTMILD